MTQDEKDPVEEEHVSELPDREAMSVVGGHGVMTPLPLPVASDVEPEPTLPVEPPAES